MALFVMVVNMERLVGERDKRCARFYAVFKVNVCVRETIAVKDARLPSDPGRLS